MKESSLPENIQVLNRRIVDACSKMRFDLGWFQQDLAKKLGVTNKDVSFFENYCGLKQDLGGGIYIPTMYSDLIDSLCVVSNADCKLLDEMLDMNADLYAAVRNHTCWIARRDPAKYLKNYIAHLKEKATPRLFYSEYLPASTAFSLYVRVSPYGVDAWASLGLQVPNRAVVVSNINVYANGAGFYSTLLKMLEQLAIENEWGMAIESVAFPDHEGIYTRRGFSRHEDSFYKFPSKVVGGDTVNSVHQTTGELACQNSVR